MRAPRPAGGVPFAAGLGCGALLVCLPAVLAVFFTSHPGQPPACQTPPALIQAVTGR